MADAEELTPAERAQLLLSRVKKKPLEVVGGSENGVDHRHEQETERPVPPATSAGSFDADLVPQIEPYKRSPEQEQLDALIDGIDIVDAYIKFCGKMEPKVGNKTEGIMVSCPIPGHTDANPSAWLNTENKTWYCGGCQRGGDIYDLAAVRFGYGMDEYKQKHIFPVLRQQIGEEYGLVIQKDNITGQEYVVESQPVVEDVPHEEENRAPLETPQEDTPSNVVALHRVPDLPPEAGQEQEERKEDELEIFGPDITTHPDLFIPWEKIAPENTFLDKWRIDTTIDDLPHEYYFTLGLMALAFAAGMNNVLMDYRPVKSNLYVCLYGRTGIGKSRSTEPFRKLLEEVFPYSEDPYMDPQGVKLLPTPNSAEAIIDSFHYEVKDPSTQQLDHMASVSALMRHEEFSGLIKKSERSGSSIKEVLIELYDAHGNDVSTHSRTSGVKRAHSPFAQMLTTTQPNAIHAFLNKTDIESGFLNRQIFAAGKGRIRPISYGGFTYDITSSIQALKDVYQWSFTGHEFYLAGPALEVWNDFFIKNLEPYKAGIVDQESIYSRVDLTLKKVIVILTVNEKLLQPTAEIVERALLLYPYLMVTYSMFGKDINFNDIAECQAKLLEITKRFEARNAYPSGRDFYRYTNGRFDNEMITRAMKNLVDLGLLNPLPIPSGSKGRPTIKFSTGA